MSIDPHFVFSANSLQDYQDCPRRFELKYMLKQPWPAEESAPYLEWEHELELGKQFHQTVYQYLNGLPQDALLESLNDADVENWFGNFLAFFQKLEVTQTFPEFRVRVPLGQFQAVAVYDLLALTPQGRLLILDWKTSKKKPRRQFLSQRMQTVLYPYAALESVANFLPDRSITAEAIEMTYVYVRHAEDNTLTFNYDAQQHSQRREVLETLVAQIAALKEGEFTLTEDTRRCNFCVYRSLCERGENAGNFQEAEDEDAQEAAVDLDTLLEGLAFDAGDEIAF